MDKRKLSIGELSAELTAVMEEIVQESDPAAAMIAAAYVDESLCALLRKIFVKGKTSTSLLQPGGGVGSYEIRAKLAYVMGFLTKEERTDLDTIAVIRNRFAHSYRRCSFQDPEIIRLCRQLKSGMSYDQLQCIGSSTPGKACYAVAAIRLAGHLQLCGRVTRHAEPSEPFQVNRESWKRVRKNPMFLKDET